MSSYSGNTYGTGRRQKSAGLTGQNRQTPDQTVSTPSPAPTSAPSAPALRNAPGSQPTFSLLTGPGNTTLPPASPMQKLAAERTLGGGRNLEMGMAKFGASSGKENFNFNFTPPNALPDLSASGLMNSALPTLSERIGPQTKPVAGGAQPEIKPPADTNAKVYDLKPPEDTGPDQWSDVEAFYNDLMAQLDADWEKSQEYLQNEMGAFQRQADLMNARMGRGIAGGYAQLQGAAMAQGMEVYGKAALEHNAQRRQSQLAFLDRQIAEMNAVRGREWSVEDQEKMQELELWKELLSSGIPYDEAVYDELMASMGLEDKGGGSGSNVPASFAEWAGDSETESKVSALTKELVSQVDYGLAGAAEIERRAGELKQDIYNAAYDFIDKNGEWPNDNQLIEILSAPPYNYKFK